MTESTSLFDVSGKVVVVTGGSRGIGYGIAEGFVRARAKVYICSRKAQDCEQAAAALSELGECHGIAANLGSIEGVRAFAAELSQREPRVDVLVNNAGNIWVEKLADYPENGWDKVFDLNVKGVFFLVQALMPLLEASAQHEDPARIINIGSIDAFHVPSHETYAYSASKAAVHMLTRHLARQLAGSHMTVNVIAPGRYRSQMLENAIDLEGADEMLGPIPLKRFAEGSDLAGAAIYLASRAGSFVTGAVLPVDGGHATTL
ncbi:SDR family NAD(P)-dependent oxidoreductase [Aeromicrobium sp. 636]|uniref:SDR family NAD(P)-dependent oxidoreductase n=1 Tax=Aeromicrobium senzhongii TaxID=2663859 RepID=A0A8I0EWT3_9ACTN|nr:MULTISPECIES: SDR family NAD(P)-dependent oxidoreductase [Aeromicrobium]MBC9226490.1 SDR family NAD(P)-dependent oxidoreductase [Aeromicrobium senzhongii]MCQ3998594.1 SDR family NAD(P)-dependent oxidoreductase [Aeromicrobium sp. 636]